MQLTTRQEEILRCIAALTAQSGTTPSVREIQAVCGYASPAGVLRQLGNLERLGALRRGRNKARSIVLEGSGTAKKNSLRMREVPIYGSIAAGMPVETEQAMEGSVHVDMDSLGIPKNARTFALKVRGDSMTGAGILQGDIVILEFKEPAHGKVVAALIDGETTLKTYVMKNGKAFLKAENPDYRDLIPARELVIQGVMVGLMRMV